MSSWNRGNTIADSSRATKINPFLHPKWKSTSKCGSILSSRNRIVYFFSTSFTSPAFSANFGTSLHSRASIHPLGHGEKEGDCTYLWWGKTHIGCSHLTVDEARQPTCWTQTRMLQSTPQSFYVLCDAPFQCLQSFLPLTHKMCLRAAGHFTRKPLCRHADDHRQTTEFSDILGGLGWHLWTCIHDNIATFTCIQLFSESYIVHLETASFFTRTLMLSL